MTGPNEPPPPPPPPRDEDRATIRGALDLLQQRIESHDYGRVFTYEEAYRLRCEALAKVASARAVIRSSEGKS